MPAERPRRSWVRRRAGVLLLVFAGASALAVLGYWQWDRARTARAWASAEDALARHDLDAAATHLDRYLTLRPEDPAGWFRASRTARRRGQLADAKRYLAQYEMLGGEPDAARLERDLLLVQQGLIGRADARLRATIDPDHPDVVFVLEALARGYLITERWADARQACELWRAIQPQAPWPWLWGGRIRERMADLEEAAELFRHTLELVPEDRDARVSLARVLARQRKPVDAAVHYELALARFPDDPEALLGLAQCRIDEGRVGEALPLIERVLATDPTSQVAHALRGRAAMEAGDSVGAERWLRRAVEADPSDAEALHQLIRCLHNQRKDAEAEQLAGKLDDLRKDLRRLTELMRTIGPQMADAAPCHEAGVIALRIGRTEQGLNMLRDALRRKGDHRPTHAALAAYYLRTGNPDLAQQHQTLADRP